jgi:hypothetical protein
MQQVPRTHPSTLKGAPCPRAGCLFLALPHPCPNPVTPLHRLSLTRSLPFPPPCPSAAVHVCRGVIMLPPLWHELGRRGGGTKREGKRGKLPGDVRHMPCPRDMLTQQCVALLPSHAVSRDKEAASNSATRHADAWLSTMGV